MAKKLKTIEKKNQNNLLRIKKVPKLINRIITLLPHYIIITKTPNNFFLAATDFSGKTKILVSPGHFGFRGKSKTAFMAVATTTEEFFKKVWNFGIRIVFFKTHGFLGPRRNLKKTIETILKTYRFKYIGFESNIVTSFNGCKKKKGRRK